MFRVGKILFTHTKPNGTGAAHLTKAQDALAPVYYCLFRRFICSRHIFFCLWQ